MKRVLPYAKYLCGVSFLLQSTFSTLVAREFDLQFVHANHNPPADLYEMQLLLKVVSEPEDGRVHDLLVSTDATGNLLSITRRSERDSQEILKEALFRRENVLAQASGRDAVFISCIGCSEQTGGRLLVKYLYDGMWNTYHTLEGKLVRTAEDRWNIQTTTGTVMQRLTLKSRTFWGKLIGIDRIEIN